MARWRAAFFALLVLCMAVGCASFGKFQPGAKDDVAATCRWLDSGNPVLGALCLTAEEVTSIFSHVKASRAFRKEHALASRTVDVCAAPVPAQ